MKKKILIVDNNSGGRLEKLEALCSECLPLAHIYAVPSINRQNYISGQYDLVLAHEGNHESADIEEGWDSPDTRIILFSGGNSQPLSDFDGIYYAKDTYLTDKNNLNNLLNKILENDS